jgi:4-diphosphocytidyl-2-C-methyl-D-erythritol kinase
MALEKRSPCKVNLLLNILGKRTDGFHELETVMHPVSIFDELSFDRAGKGIELTCSEPTLPMDSRNLVVRAAEKFFETATVNEGVKIHLEKKLPLAAGLGGGSGNAATTLLGLNELFGTPLAMEQLQEIAGEIGSDIPFFLQKEPALATGRGEKIEPVGSFAALKNAWFVLIHPGFGVPTAWAYQQFSGFPEALNGRRGRAREFIELLQTDLLRAAPGFYNAFEAPVLRKYPLLALFQEFLRTEGAPVTLMSGSGSTTFAVVETGKVAEMLIEKFRAKFGDTHWVRMVRA